MSAFSPAATGPIGAASAARRDATKTRTNAEAQTRKGRMGASGWMPTTRKSWRALTTDRDNRRRHPRTKDDAR